MNFDLIIKLAKLANENPNENEANAAAKKVCQLIKAGDYKFNGTVRPQQPNARAASNSSGEWSGFDWFRDFYYTRPDYKDKYKYGSWDIPKNEDKSRSYTETKQEYKNRTSQDSKKEEYEGSEYSWVYWDEFGPESKIKYETKKPETEREIIDRLLKCKTCGKQKLTGFVGLESMYECFTCQFQPEKEK